MEGTVVRARRSMMAVPAAVMTPVVVPKVVGAEAAVAAPVVTVPVRRGTSA